MALIDHDTTVGHAEARQALTGHLTPVALLPGMELSCRPDGRSRGVPGEMKGSSPRGQQSVHLLAYLFDPDHSDLATELSRIRDDRALRAQAMVRWLADLGVGIIWDQVAAITGPAVIAARTSPAPWRPAAP